MKKTTVVIIIILLAAALIGAALFLMNNPPNTNSHTDSAGQNQQSEDKSNPGVHQEESGPKSELPEKANSTEPTEVPDYKQNRDTY